LVIWFLARRTEREWIGSHTHGRSHEQGKVRGGGGGGGGGDEEVDDDGKKSEDVEAGEVGWKSTSVKAAKVLGMRRPDEGTVGAEVEEIVAEFAPPASSVLKVRRGVLKKPLAFAPSVAPLSLARSPQTCSLIASLSLKLHPFLPFLVPRQFYNTRHLGRSLRTRVHHISPLWLTLFMCSLSLSGSLNPSLLTLPYYLYSLSLLTTYALRPESISVLLNVPLLSLASMYSVLIIVLTYVWQFSSLHTSSSLPWSGYDGHFGLVLFKDARGTGHFFEYFWIVSVWVLQFMASGKVIAWTRGIEEYEKEGGGGARVEVGWGNEKEEERGRKKKEEEEKGKGGRIVKETIENSASVEKKGGKTYEDDEDEDENDEGSEEEENGSENKSQESEVVSRSSLFIDDQDSEYDNDQDFNIFWTARHLKQRYVHTS
jgi:hypothetical protein